jgi:hypothetical protein
VSTATATLPRGLVIARAWSALGDAVAPLSNAAGRPLTRTVKLILDPLVLRPVLNPEFGAGAVAVEHVDALRSRITGAGPVLAATASWFVVLKKQRRRLRVTEGNPQDLYFQRCDRTRQAGARRRTKSGGGPGGGAHAGGADGRRSPRLRG